jgi:hypothetical protein
MNNEYGAQAHSVLEYLLTKAALDGSPRSSTLRIAYSDLLKGIGQMSESPENNDLVLVLDIKLSWDSHNKSEKMLIMDEDDIIEGGF